MAPAAAEALPASNSPASSAFHGMEKWSNWFMCFSLCAHFAAYELIRSGSVTLLTGYIGSEGLGYSITAGFPLSALALWTVHYCSRHYGVRHTLRLSHLLSILVIAIVVCYCDSFIAGGYFSTAGIICFYCFREIYVGIIATQNWSFVRVPYDLLIQFAGMVSVASVLGSFCVEFLVKVGGVRVLLLAGILMQGAAWALTELSFATLGAAPDPGSSSTKDKGEVRTAAKSFFENCASLLGTNKTLQLLFLEAIVHQACSNLLNVMFYDGLRRHVSNDAGRAVLIGRFFAAVNFFSSILQCLVIPKLMNPRNAPMLLLMVPLIVLVSTSLSFSNQSLLSVMLGFGIMKVLEYSVMTSAMELIYMPMEHEVRYLGKELIRFFGHRLGKSGTSLLLSAASAHFRPSLPTQTIWSGTLAAAWGASMYLLSSHLDSTYAADAAAARVRRKSRGESLGTDPRSEIVGRSKSRGESLGTDPRAETAGQTRLRGKSLGTEPHPAHLSRGAEPAAPVGTSFSTWSSPVASPREDGEAEAAAPQSPVSLLIAAAAAAAEGTTSGAVQHKVTSSDERWTDMCEENDTASVSSEPSEGSEGDHSDKLSCSSTSSSSEDMKPYPLMRAGSGAFVAPPDLAGRQGLGLGLDLAERQGQGGECCE